MKLLPEISVFRGPFRAVKPQPLFNTGLQKSDSHHPLHKLSFRKEIWELISFSHNCSVRTEAVLEQLEDLKLTSGGIAKSEAKPIENTGIQKMRFGHLLHAEPPKEGS